MMRGGWRFVFLGAVVLTVLGFSLGVQAQSEPPLPAPLKNFVDEGAQIRYLGRQGGLDGWMTLRSGQEQYFYVTPDGESMVMGLLFDKDGKLVTVRQVKALQEKGGDVLDLFAQEVPTASADEKGGTDKAFKTPSEQLYEDVSNSNWVRLGVETAPPMYVFVDPQCPHCHAFLQDLRRDLIQNGLVQVRLIPVGFKETTRAQAAFLLAAPNPEERYYRHLDGDTGALPVAAGVNEQGIEKNLAIMQSWRFDATPIAIYRAGNGQVKIVQGRARDLGSILKDLTPKP